MKQSLLITLFLFISFNALSQTVKLGNNELQLYEQQIEYRAINKLLKAAYSGDLVFLDTNNQKVKLNLKEETLWTGAVQYSFEATRYSYNHTLKKKPAKSKVWLNEENFLEFNDGDNYVQLKFTAGSWYDKRNEVLLRADKEDFNNILRGDDISRLYTYVDFSGMYSRLYNFRNQGLTFYKDAGLEKAYASDEISTMPPPFESLLTQDPLYPEDPYALIDTLIAVPINLLLSYGSKHVVGFELNDKIEVWVTKKDAMKYLGQDHVPLELLLKQYDENEEKGYRIPFVRYSSVTPAVLAKSSFCISGYADTLNKKETELLKNIYSAIVNESNTMPKCKDSLLIDEVSERECIERLSHAFIKQIQDPLYPDDPYALIDTTIIIKKPLVYLSFYHINDTLYSIGVSSVGYDQQAKSNYELKEGYDNYAKITRLVWLNTNMLKAVLSEDEWKVLLEIYERIKQN